MTDQFIEDTQDTSPEAEKAMLMERAATLGLRVSPKIGLETLRTKINNHINPPVEEEVVTEDAPMTAAQAATLEMSLKRKVMKEDQLKLIRVRIANLNPTKADLGGEIFTVVNKYLGAIKKFIPYGEATDDGYHVPQILLTQIKDRKFLQVRTKRNQKTGQMDITQRWVPEFSITELPPLTKEEMKDLAAAQAAGRGTE